MSSNGGIGGGGRGDGIGTTGGLGGQVNGFWHLGRFAGLYKNYYGESPSETVRAMG